MGQGEEMSVRDRVIELRTPQEVETFLAHSPWAVLFKMGSCHKTMHGFAVVEEALAGYPQIAFGVIRVLSARPASDWVAEKSGITHQSPQFLLFQERTPLYAVDNWAIAPDRVKRALEKHLGSPPSQRESPVPSSDLTPYKNLLEQHAKEELTDEEFERAWRRFFRQDTTHRTLEEVRLLEGLFGTPQARGLVQLGSKPPLRERACSLLLQLERMKESE